MSIAALKRKTMNGNPRMSPISGQGPLGFALNGTLRVNGWVDPTNLGATSYASGRGGQSVPSCCLNDRNIIKKSVMNTKAMLSARSKGFPLGNLSNNQRDCTNCPINWVQPINTLDSTAGQQIKNVKINVLQCNAMDAFRVEKVQVSDGMGGSIWVEAKYVCGIEDISANGVPIYKKPCVKEPYLVPWNVDCDGCGPGPLINKSGQGGKASGRLLAKGCCAKVLPTNKARVKSGAAMPQSEYISTRYLMRLPNSVSTTQEAVTNQGLPQGKLCYNSNTWFGCSTSKTYTVEEQINDLKYYPPHFPPKINNKHCATKYMDVVSALKAGLYDEPNCATN